MPWRVAQSNQCPANKPWAVLKKGTGEKVSCNESKEKAINHMQRLYAMQKRGEIK